MALNRVRHEATYYYAANAMRTGPCRTDGAGVFESRASSRQLASAHFEMVFQDALERPPCSDRDLVRLRSRLQCRGSRRETVAGRRALSSESFVARIEVSDTPSLGPLGQTEWRIGLRELVTT